MQSVIFRSCNQVLRFVETNCLLSICSGEFRDGRTRRLHHMEWSCVLWRQRYPVLTFPSRISTTTTVAKHPNTAYIRRSIFHQNIQQRQISALDMEELSAESLPMIVAIRGRAATEEPIISELTSTPAVIAEVSPSFIRSPNF